MPCLVGIARVPLQPKASVSESLKERLIYCATDSSPTSSPHAIPLYARHFDSYNQNNVYIGDAMGLTHAHRYEICLAQISNSSSDNISLYEHFLTLRGTRGEAYYARKYTISVKGNPHPVSM